MEHFVNVLTVGGQTLVNADKEPNVLALSTNNDGDVPGWFSLLPVMDGGSGKGSQPKELVSWGTVEIDYVCGGLQILMCGSSQFLIY